MKVLFQSRVDLFDKPGGDTTQLNETKKSLEKLGLEVDINNDLNVNVQKYDIVHIFNLDWVCEAYWYVKNAKKYKKPVVLSPIHHNLEEFKRYESEYRWGLAKVGNFILPFQPLRDSSRNLLKGLLDKRKFKPALFQFLFGIRREQRLAIEKSDYVLVQTNKEAEDLKSAYTPKNNFKWKKVVNGVNIEKFTNPNFKEALKLINFEDYILCVGRIEPRKNQLSLIQAFKELKKDGTYSNLHLVFAGGINSHHPTYAKKFKKICKTEQDIHFLGFTEQSILAAVYSKAKVFACPSWFETTGLVYLEAVVAGCNSIVGCGDRAKEYLEENCLYCDPGDINSIKQALKGALKANSVSKTFRKDVIKEYNWENTANQTLSVYNEVLKSL